MNLWAPRLMLENSMVECSGALGNREVAWIANFSKEPLSTILAALTVPVFSMMYTATAALGVRGSHPAHIARSCSSLPSQYVTE